LIGIDKRVNNIKVGLLISILFYLFLTGSIQGQVGVIRAELEQGIVAVCRPSYQIFLECFAIPNKPLSKSLTSILATPSDAQKYSQLKSCAIPLNKVKLSLYPNIFWTLFKDDLKESEGWTHTVPKGYMFDYTSLNLWTLALTGDTGHTDEILKSPKNKKVKIPLNQEETIFFPSHYLVPELKTKLVSIKPKIKEQKQPSYPTLVPLEVADEKIETQTPIEYNGTSSNELTYGKDSQGEYAIYRLKQGETLYRIVARFTDYSENADILKACEIIKKRSKIVQERSLEPGTTIKIPLDMLSDNYLPKYTEERRVAEEVKKETERLKKKTKDSTVKTTLKGKIVIIDPGHGGKDHGAPCYKAKIFEDEVNYDIACRLKKYLEEKTQAKTYITLKDKSQGFEPTNQRTFIHDTDEWVLTTPPCNPQDFSSSANLRWLLANSIMRKEEKAGISRDKMIFISIHCDFLYKSSMRGLMVYTPGANYRHGTEYIPPMNKGFQYNLYKEWKEYRPKTLTKSQLIKEEARSNTFAQILIKSARRKDIAIHNEGPAIRNVIRKSKRSVFVPAILRNTEIPTKVLIECANLNNPSDLKNSADPVWRQKMAEAIAEAIEQYFAIQ